MTYVFQAIALVVLQQAVLATVMPVTEPAVPDDALSSFPAVLVRAANPLGRHTATERECKVKGAVSGNVVLLERATR